MGVPTTQPVPQGVQHEGGCARFPVVRYCIQVQIVPVVELAHIAIVSGNPKNYVLALYVSVEPSTNMFQC